MAKKNLLQIIRGAALLFVIAGLFGCIGMPRKPAVPSDQTNQAQIAGMPDIRYFVDTKEGIKKYLLASQKFEASQPKRVLEDSASYLSLSGGGDNGAFGAGLLVGWTQSGTRPEFKLVTGVSTGALMAPFAFLGSESDPVLKKLYTNTNQSNIFASRNIFSGLMDDSLAIDHPLKNLLDIHVTENLLHKIAYEYQVKHRALLIGTTDLDAGQPVVWNMGEIAASSDPGALDLFKRVMLASASVPALFPPVMFDVFINGQAYQEMHVDGGASTQVFLYPSSLPVVVDKLVNPAVKKRRAFIIRNDKLSASWADTQRWSVSIALRAIEQIINKQGIGDLLQIYETTKLDGVEFNLAYIDSDFNQPAQGLFDENYMNALFEYAYSKAISGYPWANSLPGYSDDSKVVDKKPSSQ